MKINNDLKQYSYVLFTTLIEFYKLSMGTFLILFVPQKCDDHVCQMMEIAQSQYIINQIGLCVNAFTLLMLFCTYMWELKREKWCIKHLDSSKEIAYNNIQYVLTDRPKIDKSLRSLNIHYIRSLRLTSFTCFLNLLSSAYVIYPRYLDTSTITSYISFALLLLLKLRTSYFVGKHSYHSSLALSAYMTEALSFNILDVDQYPQIQDNIGTTLSYDYSSLQGLP